MTYTKGEDYFFKTVDYTPGRSSDPQPVYGMTPLYVSYRRNGEPVTLPMSVDPRRSRD